MDAIKIIKAEADYEQALERIEELIDKDPAEGSDEANELELLAMLAEKYEEEHFPAELPDPISAIEFRMEQMDMNPVDLEPYIGPASRVSEVMSGKRSLTKKMIQSLEFGLGIPAKVLLEQSPKDLQAMIKSWPNKLAKIMDGRGYFNDWADQAINKKLELFFETVNLDSTMPALLRQSGHRLSPITDKHAQAAWSIRVIQLANDSQCKPFKTGGVNAELMSQLAKLSTCEDGPQRAQQALAENGVALVAERHLPKTRLDGAVLRGSDGSPIIGLTLRHDRLDNFWFTLMHELAHIVLHYDHEDGQFWDEFGLKGLPDDEREKEADRLASDALVPSDKWMRSSAKACPMEVTARQLADEVGVDITIVAGKIRFETGDWGCLSEVTRGKTVQQFFPNGNWGVGP